MTGATLGQGGCHIEGVIDQEVVLALQNVTSPDIHIQDLDHTVLEGNIMATVIDERSSTGVIHAAPCRPDAVTWEAG